MTTNVLNIPLFDNDAEFFVESSYEDGKDFYGRQRYVIEAGCNKKGNSVEFTIVDRKLFQATIKRRTGKYSVNFVDMGVRQKERAETFLKNLKIID